MHKFQKGDIPWNKGLTGYMGVNETSFSRDKILDKYSAIEGKPRYNGKDGLYCTVSERKPTKDSRKDKVYMHRKRIPYARYVLEQNGINVPKGSVVYHKDGDIYNNELENLEVITRAELIKRNRKELQNLLESKDENYNL